jgi:hypothetical protein
MERAADYAMSEAFNNIVKELKKQPIVAPVFEYNQIKPDQPFKFTATYYVQFPDPQEITEEIRKKHYKDIPKPDDIFKGLPPNIQSNTPGYEVSPDVLRNIPTLSSALGDKFIPNPLPQIPDPRKSVRNPPDEKQEIPNPEELVKPVKPIADVKEMKEHALEAHATKENEVEEHSK